MELDKINEILKPLVVDKGFKEAELMDFATVVSKSLTDESTEDDIREAVENSLPYAELMQKVGNRYASGIEQKYKGFVSPDILTQKLNEATENAKKETKETLSAEFKSVFETYKKSQETKLEDLLKGQKKKDDEGKKENPLSKEDVEEMIKSTMFSKDDLAKLISTQIEKAFAPYKEKEQRERLDSMLKGHEKLKNIPSTFLSMYRLEKENDLDGLVAKIETDYASMIQEQIKSGDFMAPPKGMPKREEDDVLKFLNSMGRKK
ncbi:MAG: hypothetical protein UIG52_00685 [Bacteroidales bacterium]|nr:hypothetical protein [Bacteroidales bacterium]